MYQNENLYTVLALANDRGFYADFLKSGRRFVYLKKASKRWKNRNEGLFTRMWAISTASTIIVCEGKN